MRSQGAGGGLPSRDSTCDETDTGMGGHITEEHHRGQRASLFQGFIGKKARFVSCTVCQVELALVSLETIGEHDCHLSNQHGMVMPCMSGAAVDQFQCPVHTTVTRPTPVRCCQLSREGHFTWVDRFRKPMGREKKTFWDVSFLGHAP